MKSYYNNTVYTIGVNYRYGQNGKGNKDGKIQLTQFESLGAVRKKCADELGIDINEFIMVVKNMKVDPDEDDEKYIRDFGMSQTIFCQ